MEPQPGKKWKCSKCSKTFKTNQSLTRHNVTHDPDAQVKCQVCGVISKNLPALSSHMQGVHSNRKRPSCEKCHRVFSTSSALRQHVDTAHSTKERPRLPCSFPGCAKTYLNQGDLARHVKTEHSENPTRFPCTLCGKEFKKRFELEKHIPTHTTEKPYNCATCGRSFTQMGNMKRHEVTHLEKSARDTSKCHVCRQTFLSKLGLQKHVKVVHKNLRNYPCTFCDQRFANSSNLKRHVEAKHATSQDPIHSCDECEYRSHSGANLAYYKIRHCPARHECYFCGKKFNTFNDLISHCRVHTLEI